MPSLKDLRNRISSVKSTQKITSAMKMVAASKLRRAQEQVEAGRPYADRMERMLRSVAGNLGAASHGPRLMIGTGQDAVHLLVLATSDRGLCGGFNTSLIREARRQIAALTEAGKTVKVFCIGRKGRDALRRDHGDKIIESVTDVGRPSLGFLDGEGIARRLLELFEAGQFDVCTMIYNRFRSAISQVVTVQQLIPVALPEAGDEDDASTPVVHEFEPEEEAILAQLLPSNLAVQIFNGLMESAASEQGARMTAMDSATRNAGDMIKSLTLQYNRTRQATITSELIEIISGAEAL